MTDVQERRAPGSNRVSLDTLVEICGNELGIPAFEAEALDVSARGMHLRTAYLPDEGAPLVCRFEDQGREIVVEGVVAWRKESTKGGEFGVKFTALDSRSVDSLRELVKRDVQERGDSKDETVRGSRVRLHIDGLGSPMKARVRKGGSQKVSVGSNLEFLKVGRKLEIEDLEAGERREARIDGVEVVVDAQTQVPQLVVALRYEGVEETPEPSVLDLGAEAARPATLFIDARAVTTDAGSGKASQETARTEPAATADTPNEEPTPSGDAPAATADDDDDDGVADAVPAATRAARRLGSAAEQAGERAREASILAAKLGSNALASVGKLFGGASAKIAALRTHEPKKRRTTAPPPEGPTSLDAKRLRLKNTKRDAEGDASKAGASPLRRVTRKRALAGAAGIAALGAAIAFATGSSESEPKQAAALAAAASAAPPAARAAAQAPATPAGSPVTANVPLFGPTPMATAEPAPLGPPPTLESKAVEAAELLAAKAASPDSAEDEEFVDEPPSTGKSTPAKADKNVRPEDVKPFGRGRMHLPTIHRIRLDGAGSAIHGAIDPMGFTVLIPGRKLMEQGGAIAKRDSRIARIRTTNTPGGAQVRLAFKGSVPAYRVRLRRDYVELLISAPEKGAEKADKKASGKSSSKSLPKTKGT